MTENRSHYLALLRLPAHLAEDPESLAELNAIAYRQGAKGSIEKSCFSVLVKWGVRYPRYADLVEDLVAGRKR